MKEKQISIDKFRIIAAILIIAIHTYPLISINETLDFAFTHVFCRIGVPMFLMITGYFILPKAIQDRKQLIKYTIKIAKVYLICMYRCNRNIKRNTYKRNILSFMVFSSSNIRNMDNISNCKKYEKQKISNCFLYPICNRSIW